MPDDQLFGKNLFYACESYTSFILTVTAVSDHPWLALGVFVENNPPDCF